MALQKLGEALEDGGIHVLAALSAMGDEFHHSPGGRFGPPVREGAAAGETMRGVMIEAEQPFMVHKDIICSKSKLFKTACGSHWKAGQEQNIRLPEHSPGVFEIYMHWVYATTLQLDINPLE